MQSEQINELATALSKAQGMMESASKDAINPFFKNKYATLASVWEVIRKPLSSNGLSVIQTIDGAAEQMTITTILAHASGQWISSTFPLISGKPKPQELGSSITYMRRYALSSIVGVTSDEDDDGNAAEEHAKKQEKRVPVNRESARSFDQIHEEMRDNPSYQGMLKYYKSSTFKEIPNDKKDEALMAIEQMRKSNGI